MARSSKDTKTKKKTKSKKSLIKSKTKVVPKKKTESKKDKVKLNKELISDNDVGVIVVEEFDDRDRKSEMELRKAYLEEARSQDAAVDD
ncbi:MAG: conserved hypothetical protein [Marine Group I thaumarchaeote]|nr:MAG: conserved hypothetical protein [Marine Group I thaumarchaeote]